MDASELTESRSEAFRLQSKIGVWPYRIALILCVDLFLVLALFRYFNSGTDDAFISLWAGEQLAAGHGFINHNGEPLEICSSSLHACIISILALIAPGAVFTANKVAGMLAGAAVFVVIHVYRDVLFTRCRFLFAPYTITLLALAVNPAFLYWSMSGMETPYAALIMAAFGFALTRFWCTSRRSDAVVAICCQALYTVVRPEGIFVLLFAPIFVLFYWWFKGRRRILAAMIGIPLLFYGVVTLWRLLSFDMLFPNPVYAKSGNPLDKIPGGWSYLLNYFSSSYFALLQAVVMLGLTLYFVIGIGRSLQKRRDPETFGRLGGVFLYGLCLAGFLIVVLSGGDWMALGRFVVPYLPLLIVITVGAVFQSFGAFAGQSSVRLRVVNAGAIIFLLAVVSTASFRVGPDLFSLLGTQRFRQEAGRPQPYNLSMVLTSSDDLDLKTIGLSPRHRKEMFRLRPVFDEIAPSILRHRGRLTVITPQMGIFPYMMKKYFPDDDIEFIDLKGLCTPEIARMDLGRSRGGVNGQQLDVIFPPNDSELSRFVHERKPDLVFVHVMDDVERIVLQKSGWVVVENEGLQNIAYRPLEDNSRNP